MLGHAMQYKSLSLCCRSPKVTFSDRLLDHLLTQAGHRFIRYADDSLVMCKSKKEAEAALALIKTWMKKNYLTLHPEKTQITEYPYNGFEFLGYRFSCRRSGQRYKHPTKKSLRKFKDSIQEHTRRTNGKSMPETIKSINRICRGWFEYFKHIKLWIFQELDSWIRMRLRSILRRRHKRKGRSTYREKQQYHNSYFTELGLFSLAEARVAAVQSLRG